MSENERDIYVDENEVEIEDAGTPVWKKIAAIAALPAILIVGGIVLFATRNKKDDESCSCSENDYSEGEDESEDGYSYVEDEESNDDDEVESEDEIED